jgi:hypothetical protein
MSRPLLLVAAVLLATLGSCKPPRSHHPLSDPAQAKADTRLPGLWSGKTPDGEAAFLYVVQRSGALVDLVLLGDDGDKGAAVLHYDAFPTVLDGKGYLNLRRRSFKGEYGEGPQVDSEYIFARYQVSRDGTLTLAVMEDDPVEEAVKAGTLEGKIEDGEVALSADSDHLADFVRRSDGAKLFRTVATFKRVPVRAAKGR